MSSRRAPHRPSPVPTRRVLGGGLVAAGAVACALVAAAAAPPQAEAAGAPRLIHTYRVNTIGCVPGPYNTVRARVNLWMRVVNYSGIGDWADRMEAKVRLEPTTAGINFTRRWTSSKTPVLVQDKRHHYNFRLLSDNVSGNADWRVHVKLIWHRPAPIRNVTKHVYFRFDGSCADPTGGGTLPPPAPALPSPNSGG